MVFGQDPTERAKLVDEAKRMAMEAKDTLTVST